MIKQTKGALTLAYLRGEETREVKPDQLLDILRKRNDLIRKLHAYYKYKPDELAAAFRLSRSGIYYIINSREEFGDRKKCEICPTIMFQGNLDYHIWQRKKYCHDICKEEAKKRRNDIKKD